VRHGLFAGFTRRLRKRTNLLFSPASEPASFTQCRDCPLARNLKGAAAGPPAPLALAFPELSG
jgi:hypothetical protein